MPEIRQDFFDGFSRSANDENAVKSLLVFTICFHECLFQRIAALRCATLFLRRPTLRASRGFRRPPSFTDPWMTVKRLQPIRGTQIPTDSIGSRQEGGRIWNRTAGSHSACPSLRSTTRKYLLCRFARRQKIPAREDIAHAAILAPGRPCKNSPRRLRSTAVRYSAVERMSLIG